MNGTTSRLRQPSRAPDGIWDFPYATELDGALLLMTMASGFLDVVSFLSLGGVFTSVMTGNTLILGLGQRHLKLALRSFTALLGFIAGGLVGSALIARDHDDDNPWPRSVSGVVGVGLLCLVAFAAVYGLFPRWPPGLYREVLLTAGGAAMGLQSLAVFRRDRPGLRPPILRGRS